MLRRLIAALGLVLIPSLAFAQAVPLQAGPPAPGRTPMYSDAGEGLGQPVIQDSGPAAGGQPGLGLAEQLLVARGQGAPPYANAGSGPNGTNWCDYDGPITGPYHYLCLSANAQGGPLISTGAGNGAAQLPFSMGVNGTMYQFPFVLSGIVGPSNSTIGGIPYLANTNGTLLGDGSSSAAKQLQIVDASAHSINDNVDLLRVQLGPNLNTKAQGGCWEYNCNVPGQAAITGLIRVPADVYSGPTDPTAASVNTAVSGYVVNDSAGTAGVAFYSYSGTDVDNAFGSWGSNLVVANTAGYSPGSQIGHEFQRVFNSEFDTVVYCKAALVAGACPSASMPHGLVKGVISELNADTRIIGPSMIAFEAVGSINYPGRVDQPWDIAYSSDNGGAIHGISLGSIANTTGSNSQDIAMVAVSSAAVALEGQMFEDSVGDFNIINQPGGQLFQMPGTGIPQFVFSKSNPGATVEAQVYNQSAATNSSATLGIQVGATTNYATLQVGGSLPGLIIATGQGPITLNPATSVTVSTALAVGGATTLVGQTSVLAGFAQTVSSPPASSSAACSIGTETWDANYEYRCVATNSWVRSAHSTF